MNRQLATLLVTFVVVFSACSGTAATGSPPAGITLAAADVPRATPGLDDAAAASRSVNAFGLDLYRHLAATPGNLVASPASIALALAMARAGARGETASQMDSVLHSPGLARLTDQLNALDLALADRNGTFRDARGNPLQVSLRIANAPFAQKDVAWQPEFLRTLAASFGAGLRLVDYRRDPEAARSLINGWVSDQTQHRIPELIGPRVLDTSSRLTLVNAIYLKAPWATPFAREVKPAAFTRPDGSQVQAPTMSLQASLAYAAGPGWRAVELPYVGGSLAMDILVPDDLASFEKALASESFVRITGALQAQEVRLSMPRFSIETATELSRALGSLGMPLAFDPNAADFSGMTTEEKLYVSAVVHQSNIDVDENGTEASAATAVVMAAGAAPAEPITLSVDRPFLFALRDVPSGAILFIGRVADPTVAG